MTTDTKQLAEFAAGFLGWHKRNDLWRPSATTERCSNHLYLGTDNLHLNFFSDEGTAPILAHLAKREMEKRGFEWCIGGDYNGGKKTVSIDCSIGKPDGSISGSCVHENEYIALWSAIEATGEK